MKPFWKQRKKWVITKGKSSTKAKVHMKRDPMNKTVCWVWDRSRWKYWGQIKVVQEGPSLVKYFSNDNILSSSNVFPARVQYIKEGILIIVDVFFTMKNGDMVAKNHRAYAFPFQNGVILFVTTYFQLISKIFFFQK